LDTAITSQIYKLKIINDDLKIALIRLKKSWQKNEVRYYPEELFKGIQKPQMKKEDEIREANDWISEISKLNLSSTLS